jgi:hypothetical protein
MADTNLDLPFWGRIVVFIINLLPIPAWIKVVIPVIIALIEKLPREQRLAARQELVDAARKAKSDGNASALMPILHKHCSGVACPPGLVGDSAREND